MSQQKVSQSLSFTSSCYFLYSTYLSKTSVFIYLLTCLLCLQYEYTTQNGGSTHHIHSCVSASMTVLETLGIQPVCQVTG